MVKGWLLLLLLLLLRSMFRPHCILNVRCNHNIIEYIFLTDVDLAGLHQLQNDQESNDDLHFAVLLLQKLSETEGLMFSGIASTYSILMSISTSSFSILPY